MWGKYRFLVLWLRNSDQFTLIVILGTKLYVFFLIFHGIMHESLIYWLQYEYWNLQKLFGYRNFFNPQHLALVQFAGDWICNFDTALKTRRRLWISQLKNWLLDCLWCGSAKQKCFWALGALASQEWWRSGYLFSLRWLGSTPEHSNFLAIQNIEVLNCQYLVWAFYWTTRSFCCILHIWWFCSNF